MSDPELARRIVDQIERGIRRDGLTGSAGGTEARRRFAVGCPWPGEFNTEREGVYRRAAKEAFTRLFALTAPAVEIEVRPGLVVLPELAAWLAVRGVALREREGTTAQPEPDPSGAEQVPLDTEVGAGPERFAAELAESGAVAGRCAACKSAGAERMELGAAGGRAVYVWACDACLPRVRAEAPAMLAAIERDARRVQMHTAGDAA